MQKSFFLSLLTALLFTVGCSTPKPVVNTDSDNDTVVTEMRDLDTMTVTPEDNGVIYDDEIDYAEEEEIATELAPYAAAYNRTHDLLHTKLEVSFDWDKEMVMGKATLRLTPIFRSSDELTLDAKSLDFTSIALENGPELEYTIGEDQQTVTIMLDKEYKRGEEYTIVLDYTAVPAESGGSAAITSDKGLFFINPRGEEGNKPRQIWTQGETENNSRWFPTIDKPNERTTQEIYVTVDNKYKTLSNGVLVNSTDAGNGKRTDYWKMDLPHAPYLFALVVGEFEIVEDEDWNGIPVNYYMEGKWAPHAKAIYPYTREMLGFFSERLNLTYPWPKYSQVAVRDYVSGAMENTTAVIFGDFMHGTERDLIDVDRNEKIVAHEMFHHWFGDYVTCESWANLTLNEGFANYSEYLWMEEKHGKDAADYHLIQEWQGYLGSVRNGEPHELIWYDYEDKEDMFDAHSYNKGGSVLHMLRNYLGDEAFFASLTNYLKENQYSAVEVDELRIAFEDTTGEDLNWFFNQWFLMAGHPQLRITNDYADGEVTVTVTQTQSTDNNVPAVFRIPVNIQVVTDGNSETYRVWIEEREQSFTFPSASEPEMVIFDPEHQLLAEYDYEKSPSELAAQFRYGKAMIDRYSAVSRIGGIEDNDELKEEILTAALEDKFYAIRGVALQSIEDPTPTQVELIREIARSDRHSQVRAGAIAMLTAMEDIQLAEIATAALEARPYSVVAAGLEALVVSDPEAAAQAATTLEEIDNGDIAGSLASLYSQTGKLDKLPYFERQLETADGYDALNLYTAYQELIAQGTIEQQTAAVARLKALALDQKQSGWRRLSATKAISDLSQTLGAVEDEDSVAQAKRDALLTEMSTSIGEIKAAETNEELKSIYQQF